MEEEGEEYVNWSILNIRDELTTALRQLPEGSASTPNVRSMRDACNAYLQATPGLRGTGRCGRISRRPCGDGDRPCTRT